MVSNVNNMNLDAAELFNECLSQATVVIKQVLPSHLANATPDSESDVRDVINHMLTILAAVSPTDVPSPVDMETDPEEAVLDQPIADLSVQWQLAADKAEASVEETDPEDSILYQGEPIVFEDFMTQVAGDLLIHAWDLGEAIGMPVRFAPAVAEAVMETTTVPNPLALPSHNMFVVPINPPANADLQARLLAMFGRSHAWRTVA